ncbi:MAG: hypothetical protein OQJ97_18560 [Rhodospirillales bacterium]|nr:hypothetical protein [Rhodospirillales bacterium]
MLSISERSAANTHSNDYCLQKNLLLVAQALGLRLNIVDFVSGSLEFAQPLVGRAESRGEDGQAGQAYFGLAVRY